MPRGGGPGTAWGGLEGISPWAGGKEILEFSGKNCSYLLPAEELVGGGGTRGQAEGRESPRKTAGGRVPSVKEYPGDPRAGT